MSTVLVPFTNCKKCRRFRSLLGAHDYTCRECECRKIESLSPRDQVLLKTARRVTDFSLVIALCVALVVAARWCMRYPCLQ